MSSHYMPKGDKVFDEFFSNLDNYVSEKTSGRNPEWTHIPQADINELNAHHAKWREVYEITLGKHNSEDIREKNRVRKITETALRGFINYFLRHKAVSDYDRDCMKITNRRSTRTLRFDVNEAVALILKIREISEIQAFFTVKGAANKAKPTGYYGAVFAWGFSDEVPKTIDELPHRVLATRSPFSLKFNGADRGKRVWISAAWQNRRGIIGNFCPVQTTLVP